jgi:hypothetical protein
VRDNEKVWTKNTPGASTTYREILIPRKLSALHRNGTTGKSKNWRAGFIALQQFEVMEIVG